MCSMTSTTCRSVTSESSWALPPTICAALSSAASFFSEKSTGTRIFRNMTPPLRGTIMCSRGRKCQYPKGLKGCYPHGDGYGCLGRGLVTLSPAPRIGRAVCGVGAGSRPRQGHGPPRRLAAPDGGGASFRPCPAERALLRLLAAGAWQSRDGPAPRGRGPAEGGQYQPPAAAVAAR